MANLKVSIIEKVKQADGTWTNLPVMHTPDVGTLQASAGF